MLGIHGDPMASRRRIDEARQSGERFEGTAYTYKRAFTYVPSEDEQEWLHNQAGKAGYDDHVVVLDPTAGGGSIPFEASRLGLGTIANDLNPVAWLLLKATVELPSKFGQALPKRFKQLGDDFVKRRDALLAPFFPPEPEPDCVVTNWLWARTISCPYCKGVLPLSPNWKLDTKGQGVRLTPHTDDPNNRHCTFAIVKGAKNHSPGTVKGGDALCPYPDCGRVIDGDEIKSQAQSCQMAQQLFAIVFKRRQIVGYTKHGKPKVKTIRGFRAPLPTDDVQHRVKAALDARQAEWEARDIIPNEEVPPGHKTGELDGGGSGTDKPLKVGIDHWWKMFSPRQLYGHCTAVEVFHVLMDELMRNHGGTVPDLDKAALLYLSIAIDKVLNWNAILSSWNVKAERMRSVFDRHDFGFKWSFAEMAFVVEGTGYEWAVTETGKALQELVKLSGSADNGTPLFNDSEQKSRIKVSRESADCLGVASQSVDCIVMDPPYYGNVMYAELADFFYVWLKRTAGLLYPEMFSDYLTDKDHEAVANPFRFSGKKGCTRLAGQDYQERMAAIFAECRRVLKPQGVMTVMFTHKASGAWDALATGLVRGGFVITASWPVNTEAEGSLHIKEKSAAKSTIFLVCRVREERAGESDPIYWEEVEPRVQEAVRQRIEEFQAAGIGGIDLYLASFGPALQVFSESWPLKRGRAIQKPKEYKLFEDEDWDPYAVRPEDALDAARKEVKRWRMEQLATVKRQHHLDPVSEWYVLAWDAFKAPRFPVDEALKLARVVGLDFDQQVKNHVCEVKSSDVILWDSKTRQAKGKLGPVGESLMLDTLHQAAVIGRDQNTGAARTVIEKAGLLGDATLLTTLEALLNVLPPAGIGGGKKVDAALSGASSDFDALEKLRRLAFAEEVPAPKEVQPVFPVFEAEEGDDETEE
jgi:adenine-specific DNA methylase